ncbi:ATP-binding cassette domain-containing protein [Aquihabitans sp. McL0605]|uniref:ATP-binding cassette domain-containing protein n=1 Tax=Aquihabitans sp. McL0605 TaxID=3415671 RepID=UPI003CEC8CF9
MARTVLVDVSGVARTFGRGPEAVVAVHDVTCTIRAGDRIALVGPSGSGKTTLLHLLAGLDQPTTGSIEWPGIGGPNDLRPGAVAVVFQAPSLVPPLDVTENVALPLLLSRADRAVARARALDALAALGLAELATRLPEELSGGQAQRVAVARAVAADPKLLLADEPTGQLDHHAGAAVVDALLAAADRTGAALVVNTHDPAVADRLGLRWSMTDGGLRAPELIER